MNDETQVTLEESAPAPVPTTRGPGARAFWAALAIVVIWVAVAAVGIFAEIDFELQTGSTMIRVPVVWGIGLLAFLATWVIAWRAFRPD
jgi:hypothetical protein